jgi:hypothetical protein
MAFSSNHHPLIIRKVIHHPGQSKRHCGNGSMRCRHISCFSGNGAVWRCQRYERQNLLLSWFGASPSRHIANLLHHDLNTRSTSKNIIHSLSSHINRPYWAIEWHTEVHNRVHVSCHSQAQELWLQFCANNIWYIKICFEIDLFHIGNYINNLLEYPFVSSTHSP